MLSDGAISISAIAIMLLLYGCMLFRFTLSRLEVEECFQAFQKGMKLIAFIIIAQQLIQYSIGNKFWPNIHQMLPSSILLQDYAYIRPLTWNSPYLTPNGFFFLEPSAASAFLATALVIEILMFRRTLETTLYLTSIFVGMAGTGPAVIAIISPFLFFQVGNRFKIIIIALVIPILVLAFTTGALDRLIGRANEFSDDKSSGYARIVVPFNSLIKLVQDESYLLTGNGAGSSPKGGDQVQWPASKLTYEYGLLVCILFHLFVTCSMLGKSVNKVLSLAILIPHLCFGGGFVSHTNLMLLVLFGSLLSERTWKSPQHLYAPAPLTAAKPGQALVEATP